ncbi:MAG: endolytic transglycosylase MltG [bacterium]
MVLSKPAKIITIVICGLVFVVGLYFYNIFYGGNTFDVDKKSLYVSKGDTWNQIVDSLETNGIVRNRSWFEFVVEMSRQVPQLHVGKYEFKSGISNNELFDKLRQGKGIVPIAVTLREGRRAESFSRSLGRRLHIDTLRFMSLVNDKSFAESLGVEAANLEGYLSPNTYNFQWQEDEEEIIKRLVHQTEKLFTDSLRARAAEMKMTIHQVITFASLIEGEAMLDSERARISGVYHNRLERGMKLQADPTIQYIIDGPPRRLRFVDLFIKSPYNTYRNFGLPPGPISNPRAASIIAALYPEHHNYIFFVANGSGGHWFSTNYAAHLDNVKKFKQQREEQIRLQGISEQNKGRPKLFSHHPPPPTASISST